MNLLNIVQSQELSLVSCAAASIALGYVFYRKYTLRKRLAKEKTIKMKEILAAEQIRHTKLYSEHKNIERRKRFDGGPEIAPSMLAGRSATAVQCETPERIRQN